MFNNPTNLSIGQLVFVNFGMYLCQLAIATCIERQITLSIKAFLNNIMFWILYDFVSCFLTCLSILIIYRITIPWNPPYGNTVNTANMLLIMARFFWPVGDCIDRVPLCFSTVVLFRTKYLVQSCFHLRTVYFYRPGLTMRHQQEISIQGMQHDQSHKGRRLSCEKVKDTRHKIWTAENP